MVVADMKSQILSSTQLRKLKEHKYASSGVSLLEPLLQPYWCWVVEQIPRWLAPNLLTLVGLACTTIPISCMVYQSPQARSEVSPGVLICSAIGMFLYQTLDAIDGKQARRTGTSSPLGELFDHGCDSVSGLACAVSLCCCMMYGREPSFMFACFFVGHLMFYGAHWQGYVRGILIFGKFDVTETQLGFMALYFFNAIFGCSFWDTQMFGIKRKYYLTCTIMCITLFQHVRMFRLIFAGGQGKNGSTIAGTSILSPAIPVAIVMTPAFYIFKHSQNSLFQTEPLLSCCLFGVVISKLSCKLIVSSMTKHSIDMLDVAMIGPIVLAVINYFGLFGQYEYTLLYIFNVFVLLDLVLYASRTCREICVYLNINCLTIPSSTSKVTD